MQHALQLQWLLVSCQNSCEIGEESCATSTRHSMRTDVCGGAKHAVSSGKMSLLLKVDAWSAEAQLSWKSWRRFAQHWTLGPQCSTVPLVSIVPLSGCTHRGLFVAAAANGPNQVAPVGAPVPLLPQCRPHR